MDDIKERPLSKQPEKKEQVRVLIAWEAPEFRYFEKTAGWFTGSIVIAVLIGLFALWQTNFLFLIFIAIAEALVLFWGKQPPRMLSYEITPEGINQGGTVFFPFGSYEAFALVYDDRLAELILRPKRALNTYTKLLLPVSLREEVVQAMSAYLPAFEYEETVIEHLTNRMRL